MATLKRWTGTAWEYVGLPTSAAIAGSLGYQYAVADQSPIVGLTALNGLTVTVTLPSARRLKITGAAYFSNTSVNAAAGARLYVQRDGVSVQQNDQRLTAAGVPEKFHIEYIDTPAAGTYTYRLAADNGGGGSVTMWGGGAYPAFILVEDITGVGVSGHTHAEFDDTGWIVPTLLNSWVSFDNTYGPPRYRRKNGIVYLQGLVKNGTLGPESMIFPAGFRPSMVLLFGTQHATGSADVRVEPDGRVIMALANQTWTAYNGIIFPADQ